MCLWYSRSQFILWDSHHNVCSNRNPAHFHEECAGNKALVDVQGSYVIRGALPSRQLKLILVWCELHRDEPMQNWELSKVGITRSFRT